MSGDYYRGIRFEILRKGSLIGSRIYLPDGLLLSDSPSIIIGNGENISQLKNKLTEEVKMKIDQHIAGGGHE